MCSFSYIALLIKICMIVNMYAQGLEINIQVLDYPSVSVHTNGSISMHGH